MGREIKFRVWNTISKEMTLFDTPFFTCIKDPVVGFRNCACKRIMIGGYTEAMQFVGIFDKNGKSIYEGDIVKGTKPKYISECIGVVEYHGMSFGYWGKRNDGTAWMDTVTSKILEKDNIDDGIEVIGNVYENPEILY